MAHLCQHVVLLEISQVSLNDSVAVVQQIERPAGFPFPDYDPASRTVVPLGELPFASRDVSIIAKNQCGESAARERRGCFGAMRSAEKVLCISDKSGAWSRLSHESTFAGPT